MFQGKDDNSGEIRIDFSKWEGLAGVEWPSSDKKLYFHQVSDVMQSVYENNKIGEDPRKRAGFLIHNVAWATINQFDRDIREKGRAQALLDLEMEYRFLRPVFDTTDHYEI